MAEVMEIAGAARDESEGLSVAWRHRDIVLLAADFLIVVASFLVAYYLRFHLQFMAIKHVPLQPVIPYLKGALILATVWVFLVWKQGGYKSGLKGTVSFVVRIRGVLLACVKALAVTMVVSYMYRQLLLSRQVYLMTGVFALAGIFVLRLLVREMGRDLAARNLGRAGTLVVGLDRTTEEFAARLGRSWSGIALLGFVTTGSDAGGGSFAGYPVVGDLEGIGDLYERTPFENLVLSASAFGAASADSDARFIDLINFCEERNIALYNLPNVCSVAVAQNEVGTFGDLPVVRLRDSSLHPVYAVVKRLMDIAISAALIAIGFPLWAAIACIVKWTSKGPALYCQERVGLYGRPYRMLKFRSMVADADAKLKELVDFENMKEPVFNLRTEEDPRITPVGRFLRRTSLDEIPQLWNVLKGDMSLVGPRPERVSLAEKYNAWQRRRLKAKPGITGLQQVARRGDPSLAVRIKYDLIYLKNQSLLLDLYILVQTVLVVFRGTGVAR